MALRAVSLFFCACLLAAPGVHAATRSTDKSAAAPEMSDDELKTVHALLEQMAAAFVAGDDKACMQLFSPNAESRDKLAANLQSEFHQTRYLKFEIVQVQPEDKLKPNIHSVDVRLRTELVNRDRPVENQIPIKNSTSETFIVRKMDDGKFLLQHSPFFDNLGMQKGMGFLVGGLLFVMALCAVLAFWVWMGWEAWRARPREVVWRTVVCLPVLGAFIFFFGRYLPRVIKGPKENEK